MGFNSGFKGLITPFLYNAVRTGKCTHSFYRRYIPVTPKKKIVEA